MQHFNDGVHAREAEFEDILKKYVKSQEELASKREKAEAEQKALALAQAQSAALAAAASAESRSAGALTALCKAIAGRCGDEKIENVVVLLFCKTIDNITSNNSRTIFRNL